MIFFLALIPATILSIAGFGALFLAQRAEGSLRNVGRYLGFWAFTLAVLLLLASIIVAARVPSHQRMRVRAHWAPTPCMPIPGPYQPGPPAFGAMPGPGPGHVPGPAPTPAPGTVTAPTPGK